MKPNLYETYYARLEALLGQPPETLEQDRVYRLKAPGFMDLVVEALWPCEETGAAILSLAHYYELNGDLIQDPEMTVRVFAPGSEWLRAFVPSTAEDRGRVEALTFQQGGFPSICQKIYPSPGMVRPKLRRDLNDFLGQWLRNLASQGHQRVEPPT